MLAFQEIIVHGEGLGARPDAIAELLRILEDSEVDVARLLPVVQRDIGLTSRLLRTCNSPLYGLRRDVASAREALVMIGNADFARMALLLCVEDVLRRDLPGYGITKDEFWRHGLMTAIGASHVIGRLGSPGDRDRAFTAGLLHDCGKILLDRGLVEASEKVPGTDGRIPIATERELTGFDHADAGCVIMDHWDFPMVLVHTVRCHHQPEVAGEYRDLALAVHAGDVMAHLRAEGVRFDPEAPTEAHAELLDAGIEPAVLAEMDGDLPEDPAVIMLSALNGEPTERRAVPRDED